MNAGADKILLLCGRGSISDAVANALTAKFGKISIIVENHEPRVRFVKRRMKRLGVVTTLGQVGFQIVARPLVQRRSQKRLREILKSTGLNLDRSAMDRAVQVDSINDATTIELIKKIAPKVVLVNGTRIIGKKLLSAISATIINTHCGITPAYRGSHGGYWAKIAGDLQHCGVTVHLVDPGIDTGGILAQALIIPTKDDTIVTYPYLQIAAALPSLLSCTEAALAGKPLECIEAAGPSDLWYHPTLWGYLWSGVRGAGW